MNTCYVSRQPHPESTSPVSEAKSHPGPEINTDRDRAERSRLNGAKSRGPITEEGKAKSSQNARKHGLSAETFLVDPADEEAYNDFKQGIVRSLAPANEVERLLVENVVKLSWKLRQADNIETDLLRDNLDRGETLHDAFSYDTPKMMALSLYQTRIDRRLQRLFDQLRKMRAESKIGRATKPSSPGYTFQSDFLKALGEEIAREKARRGIGQNDKTNPEIESTAHKNEPGTPGEAISEDGAPPLSSTESSEPTGSDQEADRWATVLAAEGESDDESNPKQSIELPQRTPVHGGDSEIALRRKSSNSTAMTAPPLLR